MRPTLEVTKTNKNWMFSSKTKDIREVEVAVRPTKRIESKNIVLRKRNNVINCIPNGNDQ